MVLGIDSTATSAQMNESKLREAVLRIVLRNAGLTFLRAGEEGLGRRLFAVPVNLDADLACVLRVLRQVEQAVQVKGWRPGRTFRGKAVEALATARLAATVALSDPGAEAWLLSLERRSSRVLTAVGGESQGSVAGEIEGMEEEQDGEDTEGEGSTGGVRHGTRPGLGPREGQDRPAS